MPAMRARTLALAVGPAAVLALPAVSPAATIGTVQPCVFANTPNAVVGQGYAPGQSYGVAFGDNGTVLATADAAGTLSLPALTAPFGLRAPRSHPYEQFPLVVRDGADAVVAQASVQVAQKNAFLLPSVADISRTRRLVVSGLQSGVPVYVHVSVQTRSGDFRWRRTRRLGTPTGSCGRLDVRTRFLRGLTGLPPTGAAQVYLDAQRAPSTTARPQARLSLSLRRRVRPIRPNYLVETVARGFFDVGIEG
jgi:hypothetical protein